MLCYLREPLADQLWGKKVLPSMYTIDWSTGQMHTICSFHATRLLFLQRFTILAMSNLEQIVAFLCISWYVWTLSQSVSVRKPCVNRL